MEDVMMDLEKLNFSLNESKVYLALIKMGSSSAGNIAKEAQLDRSSTYNALNLLIKRGIVSTMYESKRTIYSPEKPNKIIDYYKEKEEIAKRIIPCLEKKFEHRKEKSIVKFFIGFKGIKTVFQDVLDNCSPNDTYYVLGSEGQLSELMPYYSPILRERKEQKKIKTKTIIRSGRNLKTKGKYTKYKRIPSETKSPITINIYPKKVAVFIWKDKPECIVIENNEVSKLFEDYFLFMWKYADKA